MGERQLEILSQEVDRLTDEIKKHMDEAERLDVIRDCIQKEIELYQYPDKNSVGGIILRRKNNGIKSK